MRALSAAVLAIFLAGPGLRAECLLLCTRPDQPAAPSTCHEEPADANQVIAGLHGCADTGPTLVTALKPAGPDSAPGGVAGMLVSNIGARPALVNRLRHSPPRPAPPASRLIPLRI